jgi:hypothetical protein
VSPRELGLELGLAGFEPVQRVVQLVLADPAEPEHGAERVAGGGLVQAACRGQLGGRLNQPGHDQRQGQLALPLRPARQQPVEADPAQRAEGGGMAVRQGADDLHRATRRRQRLAPQHRLERRDLGRRPVGQVGKRAGLDLAVLAVALAQQDRGARLAVRDDPHVHARNEPHPIPAFAAVEIAPATCRSKKASGVTTTRRRACWHDPHRTATGLTGPDLRQRRSAGGDDRAADARCSTLAQ